MNKIKKIVAVLSIASMLGVAGSGLALTTEDLQDQIAQLTAQLAQLQSQLSVLQGVSTGAPAVCAGMTFDRNLSYRTVGNDVKCLQALLNQLNVNVANAGAGSPGSETTYFGDATRAAVIRFQTLYASEILTPLGLTAGTGFVGASTRAKLNILLSGAGATTPTTPGTTPTTPGTTPTTPVTGTTEGTLTVTASATPPGGQTIYAGQEKVAIASLNVKALGSDIRVDRLDINFTARPWLNISTITISDGGNDIIAYDVTSANTIEVTAGSSYMVRLTGLNIVVPDGVTKILTVKVNPKLVAGSTTSGALTYQILANAVRGTDGVGIVQYSPSTALTARTFTVSSTTGALALSVNSANPAARAVVGSATVATENVELLRFDLKATINDVIVSKIVGTLTDASIVLQTVKLYDGDTLLAATSSTAGSASTTFDALSIRVTKDTTKTLTIKGDVRILTEGLMDKAVSMAVPATTDGITAADAGTFGAITASGSTATGKTVYAYTVAPSLSLVSAEIATTREGRTDGSNTISAIGKIKFNVTASGGDVYVDTPTAGVVATSSNATAGVVTTITSTGASNAAVDTEWVVRQGETKWFEVTSLITNSSPTASFVSMNLASFAWGTTSAAPTGVTWSWASIPLEFKTGSVYLQGTN